MSKTAIISDIHANPEAFERVMHDAREQGCTSAVCLGDIVGYGYDPVACIDIAMSAGTRFGVPFKSILTGNHDAAVCGQLPTSWFNETAASGVVRHKEQIDASRREWLGELPHAFDETTRTSLHAFYGHGSYVAEKRLDDTEERFPYMMGYSLPYDNVKKMREFGKHNVLFVGHTHMRRVIHVEGQIFPFKEFTKSFNEREDLSADTAIDVSKDGVDTIINVGSVGYPRQEPYTSYAVFDEEEQTVTLRTLMFDFRHYVGRLEKSGIRVPSWMARWYDPKTDKYVNEK